MNFDQFKLVPLYTMDELNKDSNDFEIKDGLKAGSYCVLWFHEDSTNLTTISSQKSIIQNFLVLLFSILVMAMVKSKLVKSVLYTFWTYKYLGIRQGQKDRMDGSRLAKQRAAEPGKFNFF